MSFNNCGKQIKVFAKVLRWLAVIVGLIQAMAGLVSGIFLVIAGWIGSLFLYGFGIIVEAHETAAEASVSTEAPSQQPAIAPIFRDHSESRSTSAPSSAWRCSRCNALNPAHLGTCPQCGELKPEKN